ncbi:uncharacterized protein [Amphiura filiformis]|uniref:uncharacterized protein n=1 Tax=Amphiura filiformis TaxID=82378 RepID=UPI003B20FA3C
MRLQELLGPFLQKFLVLIWSIFTHNTVLAQVTTEPLLFLHRSSRAEIKCEFAYTGAISTVTWKKGPVYSEAEDVVQYFLGSKIGPKIGKGYNLGDDNTTLIIDEVQDEDAGVWWCNVVTTDPWTDRDTSNITVIVQPEEPFPRINDCLTKHCQVYIDNTITNYSIKCQALRSRPQVTLTLYLDELRLDIDPQMRVNEDMTYDTILDVVIPLDASQPSFVVTCEAEGNSFPDAKVEQTLSIIRGDVQMDRLTVASKVGIGVGITTLLMIGGIFVAVCIISRTSQHGKRGL